MKCPARETGKGVGGVWLGPQCLRNLKDPPSETVPKGNNLKHAVVGGGEMCSYNREGPQSPCLQSPLGNDTLAHRAKEVAGGRGRAWAAKPLLQPCNARGGGEVKREVHGLRVEL